MKTKTLCQFYIYFLLFNAMPDIIFQHACRPVRPFFKALISRIKKIYHGVYVLIQSSVGYLSALCLLYIATDSVNTKIKRLLKHQKISVILILNLLTKTRLFRCG